MALIILCATLTMMAFGFSSQQRLTIVDVAYLVNASARLCFLIHQIKIETIYYFTVFFNSLMRQKRILAPTEGIVCTNNN